jgi:hypothetical protein
MTRPVSLTPHEGIPESLMEKKDRKGQAAGADDTGGEKTGGDGVPVLVVGIGAGAGSLKSLKKILGGLPFGQGAAFFLIHHPEIT